MAAARARVVSDIGASTADALVEHKIPALEPALATARRPPLVGDHPVFELVSRP